MEWKKWLEKCFRAVGGTLTSRAWRRMSRGPECPCTCMFVFSSGKCSSSPTLDRGAMAGNRQQRQTRQKVRSKECRREFPEAHVDPKGAFAPHLRTPPSKMGPSSPFHTPTASAGVSIPSRHWKAEALPWLPSPAGKARFTSGRDWWCYQQGGNDIPGAPCPMKPPPFSLPPRQMEWPPAPGMLVTGDNPKPWVALNWFPMQVQFLSWSPVVLLEKESNNDLFVLSLELNNCLCKVHDTGFNTCEVLSKK